MNRYCDGLTLADCEMLYPIQRPIHPETTSANWVMLIGFAEQGETQYWRDIAGGNKPKKRAVFNYIYDGKDSELGREQAKGEHEQKAAKSC